MHFSIPRSFCVYAFLGIVHARYASTSVEDYETFVAAPYLNASLARSEDVELNIWTRNGTRNESAPLLYGLLFEDIAHSGDGGIYGELLRNRAFQGSGVKLEHIDGIPYRSIVASENPTLPFGPVIDGWTAIGDARISLDLLHPLSDALQVSLQVDIPVDATGRVGFCNDGWWGIPVLAQTYNASFWVQANGARFNYTAQPHNFMVSLQSATTGEIWASGNIFNDQSRILPWAYRKFETSFESYIDAADANNTFAITWDAEEARGQTYYFDLISLFGETYKGRRNGLRKDLAEGLAALEPKFLRFPGGNNLEGYSIQRRWKWWETVGPLENRPGRPGDWSYYNTDGLGLLEYLEWCEDMLMEPMLAVYDGFSLDFAVYDWGNSSDRNEIPIPYMGPVLQEALDELEYCMGSSDTYWGRKRAEHGHPEPFNIKYLQIGNEELFGAMYAQRAQYMYDGIKAVYPDMSIVFSAYKEQANNPVTLQPHSTWDDHIYATASFFIQNFNQWDNWRDRTENPHVYTSLLEYHVSAIDQARNGKLVPITHPRMLSAVAEAVYIIGEERNSNVFKFQCFAPLIQNFNFWRYTPYNMLFTADPKDNLYSVSYYQQKMFVQHQGTHTLPVTTSSGGFNPLFWVASIHDSRNEVYLKVANAGNQSQSLSINLDLSVLSVNGTILVAPEPTDLNAFNNFDNKTAITPQPIKDLDIDLNAQKHSSTLQWDVPPYSVSVIQFDLGDSDTLTSNPYIGSRLGQSLLKGSG